MLALLSSPTKCDLQIRSRFSIFSDKFSYFFIFPNNFSYFSIATCCEPSFNPLSETLLTKGQNLYFMVNYKILSQNYQLPLLIWRFGDHNLGIN